MYQINILLLIFTLIYFNFYQIVNCINLYSVKAERLLCQKTNYCTEEFCFVKLMAKNKQLLNYSCNLTEPLNSLKVRVRFYHRYHQIYQPFPVDVTEDVCGYLNRNESVRIVNLVVKGANKYMSENFKKCPMFGNISVTNLPFNTNLFPQILPAGQYRADAHFYKRNSTEVVISLQLFFLIEGLKAINF